MPLVWNRRTGILVSGHQRLKALDALEGTEDYELTVSVIDVDDLERRVFYLAAPQAGHVDQILSRAAEVFSPEDIDTHGNTNANGNLLYKILCEWERRERR